MLKYRFLTNTILATPNYYKTKIMLNGILSKMCSAMILLEQAWKTVLYTIKYTVCISYIACFIPN